MAVCGGRAGWERPFSANGASMRSHAGAWERGGSGGCCGIRLESWKSSLVKTKQGRVVKLGGLQSQQLKEGRCHVGQAGIADFRVDFKPFFL